MVPYFIMFPGTGDSRILMEAGAKRKDPLIRIEASSVVELWQFFQHMIQGLVNVPFWGF